MSVSGQEIRENLEAMNEPTIDFFILADHAEAVNGKLYLMGGGWDRIFVPDFNNPVMISFAIGILVPWNATNIRHTIQIAIEDPDRKQPTGFNLNASFVTGRPPLIVPGETQRTTLAVQRAPIPFKGPGAYQAVARLVGGQDRRVDFRLVAMPSAQGQAAQGGT